MNNKLSTFFQSDDHIISDLEEGHTYEEKDGELDTREAMKIIILGALTSYMEQDDKLLLLIYLLKISILQGDDQDFAIFSEMLYYLSHNRRFNDAFITMLEQLALFTIK